MTKIVLCPNCVVLVFKSIQVLQVLQWYSMNMAYVKLINYSAENVSLEDRAMTCL